MIKVFAVALLLAANLSAQVNATGTFSGQVTDAAGAAVPLVSMLPQNER